MIVIAEKINSTRKSVREAIAQRDVGFLQGLARTQAEAGADYLDVNTGAFPEEEVRLMEWLVQVIHQAVDLPLALDSANPSAIEKGLNTGLHQSRPIINSITAEKTKFKRLVPLVLQHDTMVLALCLDDKGISQSTEERFAVAQALIKALSAEGVPQERILLDPLIQPVSVQNDFGLIALEVIRRVKQEFPEVKTCCGLSNISFGLPQRAQLNRHFLTMAMGAGLDSVILDPLDQDIMGTIKTSEALLGRDRFCKNYIKACRQGQI